MAKTDKNNKKGTSKQADSIKKKPAVPASSKEILAKAAALAKPTPIKKTAGIKDGSSDTSSSDESSSGESDTGKKGPVRAPAQTAPVAVKKPADSSDDSSDASSSDESPSEKNNPSKEGMISAPAKTTAAAVKRPADSSDDPSDASSSEESSSEDSEGDKEMVSVPAKTSPTRAPKKSAPEDDSSVASSSEESSSESDSDEEEDDKSSTPTQIAPAEANKKRKADSEVPVPPKKSKLADGNADALTSGEETTSIFVGRLSWNVDNDWLAQEFAECGDVESAHVQMDRNTGRSRGFGYVRFKTADAVVKAIALNGKEIDGRAVNIDKSSPPDRKASSERRAQAFGDTTSPPSAVLFVGNLSFGVNEDTLWETFAEHGDVKSVRVPTDRDTGRPKGFAYVEFSEVASAKQAHAALQGFEFDGRSIRLDFSQPRDSAGGRGGGQGGRGGRGRGGFGSDRGRGGGRGGGRGSVDRGGRGRGRGARTGGIAHFEGQKITF